MTVAGRVATNPVGAEAAASPVGAELARPMAAHAPPLPDRLARRVVIDNVRPRVDEGRVPIKRTVGESVEVIADIFADGHDVVVAVLQYRHQPQIPTESQEWRESPLALVSPGTDEWCGALH